MLSATPSASSTSGPKIPLLSLLGLGLLCQHLRPDTLLRRPGPAHQLPWAQGPPLADTCVFFLNMQTAGMGILGDKSE